MTVTVPQACLDPAAMHQLQGMYLSLIHHLKPVALHAILAASAAHMLSLGLTEEHALMLAKQRSLQSMIIELNTIADTNNTSMAIDVARYQGPHMLCSAVEDASIVASILLLGPEFINAGHEQGPGQVRLLLQGARTLVVERHKYFSCQCPLSHPGRYESQYRLDSPVFISSVRSLAFTDIITSVPCARKPYIGKQYWLQAAIISTHEGLRMRRPDPDLGYSAWTLSLLGDCATLVEELYTGAISQQVFSMRQKALVLQLEDNACEMKRLYSDAEDRNQATSTTNGYTTMMAHKYNIASTLCHTISAQIFLLRARDFDAESPCVARLSRALYDVLSKIPMGHSVATTMLWPLWVLGCESYPSMTSPSRFDVAAMLERLYNSQRMKNVEQCLDKLRRDIWRENSSIPRQRIFDLEGQSHWVKRCWEEKIELLLA